MNIQSSVNSALGSIALGNKMAGEFKMSKQPLSSNLMNQSFSRFDAEKIRNANANALEQANTSKTQKEDFAKRIQQYHTSLGPLKDLPYKAQEAVVKQDKNLQDLLLQSMKENKK